MDGIPDDIVLVLINAASDGRMLGMTCRQIYQLYKHSVDGRYWLYSLRHPARVPAKLAAIAGFTAADYARASNFGAFVAMDPKLKSDISFEIIAGDFVEGLKYMCEKYPDTGRLVMSNYSFNIGLLDVPKIFEYMFYDHDNSTTVSFGFIGDNIVKHLVKKLGYEKFLEVFGSGDWGLDISLPVTSYFSDDIVMNHIMDREYTHADMVEFVSIPSNGKYIKYILQKLPSHPSASEILITAVKFACRRNLPKN